MKTRFLFITFIVLAGLQYSSAASQTLKISILNIKESEKGTIRIAFFTDEKGFKSEKDVFTFNYKKHQVSNGMLNVEIPVKAGVYGLSVLDDTNDSGKMEYNLFGVPKEGFGFSNFKLQKMRKPKFTDFSFQVADKEVKDVKVVMKYF